LPCLLATGFLLVMLFTASTARAGVWSIDSLAPLVGPQSQETGDGILYTDSCVSTGFCMALGVNDTGGLSHQVTLEEVYSDGTWTQVPGPAGFKGTFPSAVSCSSSTYCMAVGGTEAAIWNGASWAPAPSHGKLGFTSVSCRANTCVGVGTRGRLLVPSAELWRNGVLHRIASPIKGMYPDSIYCGSSSRCIVGGDYLCPESGPCPSPRPFAESWNGRSWSIMKGATDSRQAIDELSCVSLTWCMGVGDGHSARWNGRRWRYLSSVASFSFGVSSVSCASESSCEAIGAKTRPGHGGTVPVGVHWDGHSWTNEPIPNNHPDSLGLRAVSCASTALCTAVGDFGRRTQTPLAASWQPG
jgi:hypothetical protein